MAGFSNGIYQADTTPASIYSMAYLCKELLKSAGWTVTKSSDGTTYNSSGDEITGGNSGANGFNNSLAWYVIVAPDSGRAFCVQHITGGADSWRVKYAVDDLFTGGSPSATQVPSATDEIAGSANHLLGGGTDASPTGDAWFPGCTTLMGGADQDAPYGFWFAGFSGANPQYAWVLDPIAGAGRPVEDVDPYLIYIEGSANAYGFQLSEETGGPACWFAKGLGGEAWAVCRILEYHTRNGDVRVISSNMGNNIHNGGTDLVAGFAGRHFTGSAPVSGKGYPTLMYWIGDSLSDFTQKDTLDVNGGSDNWVMLSNVAVPWNGDLTGTNRGTGNLWGTDAGGVVDVTPPAIGNFLPPTTTVLQPNDPVSFEVTDASGFANIAVFASFPNGTAEMIYDGSGFVGSYTGVANTVDAITNGFKFTVRRRGGWPSGTVLDTSLTINFLVVDSGGNLGVV